MIARFLASLSLPVLLFSAVPTPSEHLGFEPGADYRLADYGAVRSYFEKLARSSDRIKLVQFGRSSLGKPMFLAIISSAENIRDLERFRQISRKMALGEAGEAEAKQLAREGKAVVWIDSGLHASEVAPVQHSFQLAYQLLTGESEESRLIRDRVILLQAPCINPDGLDWIAHWYARNSGTPHELAPLPHLYHKYAGHDNNRDWFMMNLPETRHVSRVLYEEWFPQIVYNQHQAPPFPARIFVPPYAEPLNPHIPASVIEGVNLIGSAMRERFAREQKPGVISYLRYDGWWNGGLRTAAKFHNMHGILTETAAVNYATPREWSRQDLPVRFENGIPALEPTIFYPLPWHGGRWSVRHAIDYMLTADRAILELAARHSEDYLLKAWKLARDAIAQGETGQPSAYIVPAGQWDFSSAQDMLGRLQLGGVRVQIATAPFQANGQTYPKGTYVVRAAQPFRPYLMDLMEPQAYPELRSHSDGPTKRPYDIAGYTMAMQMGVQVDRVDRPLEASLEPAGVIARPVFSRNVRENAAYLTIAELLDKRVSLRWALDGALLIEGEDTPERFRAAALELRPPRVALYEPWIPNADAGWTQYLLEEFRISHSILHNSDLRAADLRARFDALILPSQTADSILHGTREGESRSGEPSPLDRISLQRPEFTGGIGVEGLARLEDFVRQGGTLIALDRAAELPVNHFPLPVKPLLRREEAASRSDYYCPGSLLRINVDNRHPIGFGMPAEAVAFSDGGQAWDVTLLAEQNKGEREVRSVARYASTKLLASGWLSGEGAVLGKHNLLDVRYGKGRVVLYGFRPQFRAQPAGTFKLLLNAIYLSAAQAL